MLWLRRRRRGGVGILSKCSHLRKNTHLSSCKDCKSATYWSEGFCGFCLKKNLCVQHPCIQEFIRIASIWVRFSFDIGSNGLRGGEGVTTLWVRGNSDLTPHQLRGLEYFLKTTVWLRECVIVLMLEWEGCIYKGRFAQNLRKINLKILEKRFDDFVLDFWMILRSLDRPLLWTRRQISVVSVISVWVKYAKCVEWISKVDWRENGSESAVIRPRIVWDTEVMWTLQLITTGLSWIKDWVICMSFLMLEEVALLSIVRDDFIAVFF